MGRSSRGDAAQNRGDVVQAAARQLRERGWSEVSVRDMMSAVGMTHGGFYKQFSSKDEVAGLAAGAAFDELLEWIDRTKDDASDAAAARALLLTEYLSVEHRDSPGAGCPNTAFASDAARVPADSALRQSYSDGIKRTLAALEGLEVAPGEAGGDARGAAIVSLATMVGALTLARATAGDPLSTEILDQVHSALSAGRPAPEHPAS